MEQFKKLNEKLICICNKLLENQDLCKLIVYSQNKPLEENDLTQDERDSLLYTKIHPSIHIMKEVSEACTLLNVYFNKIKANGQEFKSMKLIITISVHNTLKYIDGGTRANEIHDTLLDIFDKQSGFGLGKMELEISEIYVPNENFSGYAMVFNCSEFR